MDDRTWSEADGNRGKAGQSGSEDDMTLLDWFVFPGGELTEKLDDRDWSVVKPTDLTPIRSFSVL